MVELPRFHKKTVATIVAILFLLLFVALLAYEHWGLQSSNTNTNPPTQTQPGNSTPAKKGALITKVSASVSPSAYSSTVCSKTFTFTGKITTSRAGTVKYLWERSDGVKSSVGTLSFAKAGTKSVYYSWSTTGDYSGWVRLATTSPEKISSSKASFTETCTFAVISVTASVSPTSATWDQVFTFTGKITVNKAGTVKYKWVRSDGGIGSTQTLTFSKAGTKPVTTSWLRGCSAGYNPPVLSQLFSWLDSWWNSPVYAVALPTYWEQIQVTSPNPKNSNKATYTFYCGFPF